MQVLRYTNDTTTTPNVQGHHHLYCNNTKCLHVQAEHPKEIFHGQLPDPNAKPSGSEALVSYVQIGKGSHSSQFSCEPNYASSKRRTISFNKFDVTKEVQTQNSYDSCKGFETEEEFQISAMRPQVHARNVKTSAHHDGSLWANSGSENATDKQQQQSFSSTFLHFNDDSGRFSHQLGYPSTRQSNPLRAVEPISQTRNGNTAGIRYTHADNVTMETPCVERIYQRIPAKNVERVSSPITSILMKLIITFSRPIILSIANNYLCTKN